MSNPYELSDAGLQGDVERPGRGWTGVVAGLSSICLASTILVSLFYLADVPITFFTWIGVLVVVVPLSICFGGLVALLKPRRLWVGASVCTALTVACAFTVLFFFGSE